MSGPVILNMVLAQLAPEICEHSSSDTWIWLMADTTVRMPIIRYYLEQSHKGEGAAISSKELERILHVKGTEIRRLVNILRSESKPICSNAMGYFYAANEQELQETIGQLSSRVLMITKARDGLVIYLENMTERSLPDGE